MWCPLCTAECQPGYTRCTDCAVDLVAEKPDHTIGWYDGRGISAVEACSYPASSKKVFASIHRVLDELGWKITAESQPYCALNAAARQEHNKILAALGRPDVDVEVDLRVLDDPDGGSVLHVIAHTGPVTGASSAVRGIVRRFLEALDQTLMTA
jgi:hypothetical protein